MPYYGHDPARFMEEYDYVSEAGKHLATIPKAAEYAIELKEGRASNNDTYSGLVAVADSIEDEETFERAFGMKKNQWLKLSKPGKKEKPETYLLRAAKFAEGYKGFVGEKNLDAAIQDIERRSQGLDPTLARGAAEEGMTPETMQAIGSAGGAPAPATPTDVRQIGQRRGLTEEQLAPQIQQAEEGLTGKQLEKIPPKSTRFEAFKAIGGGATPESKEALKALPTQKEKESSEDKTLRRDIENKKLKLRQVDQELRRMSILLKDASTKQKAIDTLDRRALDVDKDIIDLTRKKEDLEDQGRKVEDEYGTVTFERDALYMSQLENIQTALESFQKLKQDIQNAKTGKWVGPTRIQAPTYEGLEPIEETPLRQKQRKPLSSFER